jgi:hypothetical protein
MPLLDSFKTPDMTSSKRTLLVGCVLGMLGSGAAVLFTGYQDRLREYYGSEPKLLAVAALAEQAGGGQRWVELAGGRLGPQAVVSGEVGSGGTIWIPVFSHGSKEPAPIHVVLKSNESTSLDEFGLRVRDRATFRGAMVDLESANPAVRGLLAKSYPSHPLPATIRELDIDFSGPPFARWAATVHSAGGGLLVFGVICLLGFIGSCFGRRDDLIAPEYGSMVHLRV